MHVDKHLDLDAIATLKEIMEDDFGLLIETFINDGTERLAALSQEIDLGNGDAVRRSAHSFKGSSSNIGALQLAEQCMFLETQGNANDMTGLKEHLQEVAQEFSLVKQLLTDLL